MRALTSQNNIQANSDSIGCIYQINKHKTIASV